MAFSPLPERNSRTVSFSSGSGSAWGGSKAGIVNQLIMNGGDLSKLPANLRNTFINAASPEEFKEYTNRNSASAAVPAAAPAARSGGVDANALMEMYQKGLGAGANSNSGSGTTTRSVADELALLQGQSRLESAKKRQQTDDQLRLLREGNNIDLARKRVEHNMQMEGQRVALDQTQRARAKERETEAQLQRRQQSTERGNAMAAYRGL